MRVAILGNANSIHIRRWVEGLHSKGLDIHLISCHKIKESYSDGIHVHQLSPFAPLGYLFSAVKLRKVLAAIQPDILHAHYVTGYGTLATLSGFCNLMISAWGADVYDFPNKTRLHRWLVKRNLRCAKAVGSTSHCMLDVINAISPSLSSTYVTPFGVDTNLFHKFPSQKDTEKRNIVIGTVKLLHTKYGIDTLIHAFALAVEQCPQENIELVIIGNGPEEESLKRLARDLNIENIVKFKGYIDNDKVPSELVKFDIFAALSRLDSESFGVAAVEANACGLPVVVSDVSGFKEVVKDNITGLVVERNNAASASRAIVRLVQSQKIRETMGSAGRSHVVEHYSWDASLDRMIEVYNELCNGQ